MNFGYFVVFKATAQLKEPLPLLLSYYLIIHLPLNCSLWHFSSHSTHNVVKSNPQDRSHYKTHITPFPGIPAHDS